MTHLFILDAGDRTWFCSDVGELLRATAELLPGVTVDVTERQGVVTARRVSPGVFR